MKYPLLAFAVALVVTILLGAVARPASACDTAALALGQCHAQQVQFVQVAPVVQAVEVQHVQAVQAVQVAPVVLQQRLAVVNQHRAAVVAPLAVRQHGVRAQAIVVPRRSNAALTLRFRR